MAFYFEILIGRDLVSTDRRLREKLLRLCEKRLLSADEEHNKVSGRV